MAKGRWMIQLGAALVLSMVAGVLTLRWVNGATHTQTVQQVQQQGVAVVVAARDMRRGETLLPDMLKTVSYLPESLPNQYFGASGTVNGRILSAPVAQNEIISEIRLIPKGAKTGISAAITPGKRALGVKGNKVLGLSGFVQPGNRVDVVVTLEDPKTPNKFQTKTVLENIPVLATGTVMEDNGKGEPAPVDTYTLEITPQEGEKLALAATRGTLNFALRNPEDESSILTSGATVPTTLASLRQATAKKKSYRKRRPRQSVELIVGSSSKRVKF
jgi:pilus assembly protein CpaB